jgi:hypothetical protein
MLVLNMPPVARRASNLILYPEVGQEIRDLLPYQRSSAALALGALARASFHEVESLGNPLHLNFQKAIIRGSVVVVFEYDHESKRVIVVRPLHELVRSPYGLLWCSLPAHTAAVAV